MRAQLFLGVHLRREVGSETGETVWTPAQPVGPSALAVSAADIILFLPGCALQSCLRNQSPIQGHED